LDNQQPELRHVYQQNLCGLRICGFLVTWLNTAKKKKELGFTYFTLKTKAAFYRIVRKCLHKTTASYPGQLMYSWRHSYFIYLSLIPWIVPYVLGTVSAVCLSAIQNLFLGKY
jgi:hypothetical protein